MSMSRPPFRAKCLLAALAFLLLGYGPVHATIYTVGTGGGCTHTSLQSAVQAAEASPPAADLIRVTAEIYSQQQVTIFANQELDIVGGYAACNAAKPTANSRATLDGNGGSALPVLRIIIPTNTVRLRNLVIRRGDRAGDGEGGGIYFEGNGRLEVSDTSIANNVAGYGGGLYARGTGADAQVVFGPNVTVSGNTARRSGGGVYVEDATFHLSQTGSGIFLNEALGDGGGGYGGGLTALVKDFPFGVHLGVGMGNLGVIFNNKAKYGGGVALVGEEGDSDFSPISDLFVYSPVAGQPAGIRDNVGSEQGGGLYLRNNNPNGPGSTWNAQLWNAELEGNAAPDGAAIYVDGDGLTATVRFNPDREFQLAPPGFTCPAGQFCGGIIDNVAQTPNGTATDGAVIHLMRNGRLMLDEHDINHAPRGGMTIEGNRGGRLIFAGDDEGAILENVMIADNQVNHALIHVGNDATLQLIDVTLTGNSIANGNPILQFGDGALGIYRSILWEPGRTVLQCSGCTKTFERVIASERASLDGGNGTQVVVADPRFVDPDNGDYRLRAASPAVDYVPAIGGDDRDVVGLPRDVDLPIKVGPFGGIRDIGAVERQTLQPLVLNSDIDIDTRLWTELISGTLSRDSQNASGGSGSGSLRVFRSSAATGQVTIAARQCIHLPGPGRYSLNGFGRAGATGGFPPPVLDTTQLRWELRHNGGEGCTSGTVAASGAKTLSIGGWNRPANPVVFDVSPAEWTVQSSLVVNLAVIETNTERDNSVGWFDGITLEVESLDDVIFADGFD